MNLNNTTISADTDAETIAVQFIYVYGMPILSCLGIFGNCLSFLTLRSPTLKRSTTCFYMTNLAVLDIIPLLINIIFWLSGYVTIYTRWSCKVLFTIFYFAIHFNVLLIVAMSLQKYIAVGYPLKSRTWVTMKRTKITIVSLGTFSGCLNAHHLVVRGQVQIKDINNNTVDNCGPDGERYVHYYSAVWPWIDSAIYSFIPIISIFLLNILIINELRKATAAEKGLTGESTASTAKSPDHTSGKQAQIIHMLLLMSSAFFIFTLPIATALIVDSFMGVHYWETPTSSSHRLLRAISLFLMYCNHSFNFAWYYISSGRFRSAFKKILHRDNDTPNSSLAPRDNGIRSPHNTTVCLTTAGARLAIISQDIIK